MFSVELVGLTVLGTELVTGLAPAGCHDDLGEAQSK